MYVFHVGTVLLNKVPMSSTPPAGAQALSDDTHVQIISLDEGHRAAFVCPYCGKCTWEQYFSAKGCPKQAQEKKVLFPHLDVTGLSEDDRIDLEHKLESQTQSMIARFARFKSDILKSLEEEQVPLKKLKHFVLSLEAFTDNIGVKLLDEEDKQKIKAAEDVSDVFITLCDYTSFFNYHIIEHIVDRFGSASDRKGMDDYVESFHAFCKRNIFEVPQNMLAVSSRRSAKVLVLKCTQSISSLKGVDRIKGEIADIFGLRPSALQISSIKKGCIELHFLISAAVADYIFPVSPTQHTTLNAIGVRVLFCEGVKQTHVEDKQQM